MSPVRDYLETMRAPMEIRREAEALDNHLQVLRAECNAELEKRRAAERRLEQSQALLYLVLEELRHRWPSLSAEVKQKALEWLKEDA